MKTNDLEVLKKFIDDVFNSDSIGVVSAILVILITYHPNIKDRMENGNINLIIKIVAIAYIVIYLITKL